MHTPFWRIVLMVLALTPGSAFATGEAVSRLHPDSPGERVGRVVAEIEFTDAKVTFVDETIEGVFGLGILERGAVNLAPLYEQGASALEIFLALSPEGTPVPAALRRAHELARRRDPTLPETPRRLLDVAWSGVVRATPKALSYHSFQKDTGHCWGWGGANAYDALVGEPDHDSQDARSLFRDWSGIGGFQTRNGTFYDEHAELGDRFYATGFAHERAFAICVPYAIVAPGESKLDCQPQSSPFHNTVRYRLIMRGEQGGSSWQFGNFDLTGYGQGARYRSSSSVARRYTLEVRDLSKKSIICQERYEVFWRSRFSPPITF